MKVLNAMETEVVSGGFLTINSNEYFVQPSNSGDLQSSFESVAAWLNSFASGC